MISILQRVHDGSYPREFVVPDARWTDAPLTGLGVFFTGCIQLPAPPIEEIEPWDPLAGAFYDCQFEMDGFEIRATIDASFLPVGSVQKLLPIDPASCAIWTDETTETSKQFTVHASKGLEGMERSVFRFTVYIKLLDRRQFQREVAKTAAMQFVARCLEDAVIIA